jgi:hemoglobin
MKGIRIMKAPHLKAMMALTAVLFCALILAATPTSAQDEAAPQPSLYERLGGVYSIATVVDEFIERLLVNDILNANPAIKSSRDTTPKAGLKFRVTALVCQLSGGPEVYNGRSMAEAHAHLNISNAEWDEMVRVFVATLNDFKVPEKEQGELLALVGPAKADIVTAD